MLVYHEYTVANIGPWRVMTQLDIFLTTKLSNNNTNASVVEGEKEKFSSSYQKLDYQKCMFSVHTDLTKLSFSCKLDKRLLYSLS